MGETEKRLLLAILLSALILVVFNFYFEKTRPKPTVSPVKTAPQEVRPTVEAPPPQPVQTEPPATQVGKVEVTVDGPLYTAVASNRGGLIKSWKLKKYKSDDNKDFEMMPQFVHDTQVYPLELDTGNEALNKEVNSAVYEIKSDRSWEPHKWLSAPATLTFTFQRPGLTVEKSFHFSENYVLDARADLKVNGKEQPCSLLLGPAIGSYVKQDDQETIPQAVIKTNGKVERLRGEKLETERKFFSINSFAGIETRYFATVFLPQVDNKEVNVKKYVWKEKGPAGKEILHPLVLTALPINPSSPVQIYAGPKEYDRLNKINPALTQLIDYGLFAPIVKGFLLLLKLVYRYVHNYGIAIIILTFLLTMALFPLRYKQMVSMKKMQKVQPLVKAIQEKYRRMRSASMEQKQEMNKEIMEVYRKHGANPLGGCLPLLPQIPLFYAFYSLIAYSIELRKAPFMGWIKDLSEKDPYFITPILMGLTMLVQQKMSSSPGADPAQERMMLIMPIFLTFMFLNLSSGLNLYFLFSNIFGILLQKLSERWIPVEPMSPPPPRRAAVPAGRR